MIKRIRIAVLLFILLTVAIQSWRSDSKIHGWKSTLHVTVYPITADDSRKSVDYVAGLDEADLAVIDEYLESNAHAYGISENHPVMVSLGPRIMRAPPPRPRNASMIDAIRWSLTMRYWAWANTPQTSPKPDIRMYALFHDPAISSSLPESTGLSKGQIGFAHLFASKDMAGSNLVVLTHEMLHTLGATDHYDLGTGLPIYPIGYADPQQVPLYPQSRAEIMAGRIPLSETRAAIPAQLRDTMIGPKTAQEIAWNKAP